MLKCLFLFLSITVSLPSTAWALASNNIPLDSPVYLYLEKLAGFGLIHSEVKGIRPFSKAEAVRLLFEAEKNLPGIRTEGENFAALIIERLNELLAREVYLRRNPEKLPVVDTKLAARGRLRYVYLDGAPRSYDRDTLDWGGQSAFGFIGGQLRPPAVGQGSVVHTSGTEGTPLLENNEGVIFRDGHNLELRWGAEGYLLDKSSVYLEPEFLHTPGMDKLTLHTGYVKFGGGGLELEVGRDANWFGPGYRGATTLTNNAKNFDLIKLSSPEPLDVEWVKEYLGDLKYSLILSRFDSTGSGDDYRRPYFIGLKLALKPKPWYEIGVNIVRQQGGPGFTGDVSLKDQIFGGAYNDHLNSIAGIDLRFRIPWLRDTEIFGEYAGEDSAGFWPFVESYVAGFYIPRLTADGKNDLRFEYYWGSVMAYGDYQFPQGYVYHNMTPGHSQGGAAQDFFIRYGHWFSVRNTVSLEYFHTDRGKQGKTPDQAIEYKNAVRAYWNYPIYGDMDMNIMYGWERINNLNLLRDEKRNNQMLKVDLTYNY